MTIHDRLRSIEGKRARLMHLVSEMDPTAVSAHPRPGKWSIQEIIEHLVLSEIGVFGDLSELEQRRPHPRTVKDRVLYLVVMFILRFDIPVKVPSPALIPEGRLSRDELRAQWAANHDRLRAWITAAEPGPLDHPLFLHPIAGPMTTGQSLRMLEVHLDRHARQIGALAQLMPRLGP